MQWERPVSEALVHYASPTNLSASRNIAFVRTIAEAPFSGGAAGASWSTWNNARRSIVKPAAYASTRTVKGYEKLVTLGLNKSILSLEVERSFNHVHSFVQSSLIPFFEVWSEQTTCSFHNDGQRSFSVRSRHGAWTISSFKFSAFLLYWIALLILWITTLVLSKRRNSTSSNNNEVGSQRFQQKPGDAVAFSKRAPESPECHRSG